MTDSPRTRAQRRNDTQHRLDTDVDCWVSTAGPDGAPLLTPLSFWWDGTALVLATATRSPAGRNLARGAAVLGLGATRDVVLIDGTVTVMPTVSTTVADAFAARTGFDPRDLTDYTYFRLLPQRIRAWREVNELPGRELMRDGSWLD